MKFFFLFFSLSVSFDCLADKNFIIIQSTTSTRDSGFYEYIIPKYNKFNSTKVRIVAVGTGQAIRNAKRCDGDILFVHHKNSEKKFVEEGFGLYRKEVMYNDYILVGPKNDPAQIKGLKNINKALSRIKESDSLFVSRGDDSGTHKKEVALWNNFLNDEIGTQRFSWYIETGSGMGSSLNVAVNISAYTLTDRSTWMFFGNKKNHKILVENEPTLFNYYGIIPVNPKKCKNVKIKESEEFINWLLSPIGRGYINEYNKDGTQLFFAVSK